MGKLSAALDSVKDVKKANSEVQIDRDKIVHIHYSKLHRAPYQYSHLGKSPEVYEQEVRNLKDDIKAVGKILQPVLVRKTDVDDYEVIGGQHRRDASELLVTEDGESKYEFVPCIISKMTDAQAEYAGFGSNTTWDKDDFHIMHEIVRRKFLLENFPEDFPNIPDKGRMMEKLAAEMKIAKSTVGEYLQISNNLSDKAMDAFEQKQLNKSAAVEMAKLSHEEQDTLLDKGVTKSKDIKAFKEEKVEKTVHRTTMTDTVKTITTHSVTDNGNVVPKNEPEVIDVLPGQYHVVNTDMDIDVVESVPKVEDNIICVDPKGELQNDVPNFGTENTDYINNPDVRGICTCKNCKRPSRIEDTFDFYSKGYCKNCMFDLILDIADSGFITVDMSSKDKTGIIIRS